MNTASVLIPVSLSVNGPLSLSSDMSIGEEALVKQLIGWWYEGLEELALTDFESY